MFIKRSNNKTEISTLSANTNYTIIVNNIEGQASINGEKIDSFTKKNTNLDSTLGFGYRFGSGRLRGKVYYLKFWDNGELVRDYIPVIDKEGIPCLLDQVENLCYYSISGNDFQYE